MTSPARSWAGRTSSVTIAEPTGMPGSMLPLSTMYERLPASTGPAAASMSTTTLAAATHPAAHAARDTRRAMRPAGPALPRVTAAIPISFSPSHSRYAERVARRRWLATLSAGTARPRVVALRVVRALLGGEGQGEGSRRVLEAVRGPGRQ